MQNLTIELPEDPAAALSVITDASRETPVIIFKKSPICPVSDAAERELEDWLAALPSNASLRTAIVDVIAMRSLARGLTAELDVRHESPQALFFAGGSLQWHGSHGELTTARFASITEGYLGT